VFGQHRFGREHVLLGHPGGRAAVGVSAPRLLWQVEPAVDQGVAVHRGVGEEHRDLGVLDPARRAGVLPLDTDGAGALCRADGYASMRWIGTGQ